MVRNDYYTKIAQFMSFMDGIEYPRNDNLHVYPQERLLEITDHDVVSYFNFKAYHNANPSPLPPCGCCILIFILMPTLFRGGIQLIIHILVRVLSQHVHRENDNRGAESRQRILPQVGEEGMTSPRVLSVKWHGFLYHRIPEWRCDSLGNEFFEMRRAARDEVGHFFTRIIWARTAHRSLEHTNTEEKNFPIIMTQS